MKLNVTMSIRDVFEYLSILRKYGRTEEVNTLEELLTDEVDIISQRMENAEKDVNRLQEELEVYHWTYKDFLPCGYYAFETTTEATRACVEALSENINIVTMDDEQYFEEGKKFWKVAIKYEDLDNGGEKWYSVIGSVIENEDKKYIPIKISAGCDFDHRRGLVNYETKENE